MFPKLGAIWSSAGFDDVEGRSFPTRDVGQPISWHVLLLGLIWIYCLCHTEYVSGMVQTSDLPRLSLVRIFFVKYNPCNKLKRSKSGPLKIPTLKLEKFCLEICLEWIL